MNLSSFKILKIFLKMSNPLLLFKIYFSLWATTRPLQAIGFDLLHTSVAPNNLPLFATIWHLVQKIIFFIYALIKHI